MAGLPLGYVIRVASDGVLNPSSPRVSQKWQRQQFGSVSWADTGWTASSYTVAASDRNCKIRVAQMFASGQELYSNELQVDNFTPPFSWEVLSSSPTSFEATRVAYDRDTGVFVIADRRGNWAKTDRSKRRQYELQFPTKHPTDFAFCNAAWYLNDTDEVVLVNGRGSGSGIVYATLDDFDDTIPLPLNNRPWGFGPLGSQFFTVDAFGGGHYGTRSQAVWSATGQKIADLTFVDTVPQYLDSTLNIFGAADKYAYRFTGISSGQIQYTRQLLPFVGTHNKFLNSIAYHNRKWVAVGGNNHLFTSSNWTSWRANNSIIAAFPNNTNISGVCYAANKWWCTGYNRSKVLLASSPDAETWTLEDLPSGLPESGVAGSDGLNANCPKMAGYNDEAIWVVQYGTYTKICRLVT